MHARRLACFLLGLWLAGGLLTAWVSTQSLREVDRLLSHSDPAATLRFKPYGPAARAIMRFQASEENRSLFEDWETAQIIFGLAFFFAMLFGSREDKFTLGGILLILILVAVQRFILTPELISLGRVIDFAPGNAPSPDRSRFWVTHSAYIGVELVKWALLSGFAAKMIFSRERSGRSRHSRRKLDAVDKADYGRVNW